MIRRTLQVHFVIPAIFKPESRLAVSGDYCVAGFRLKHCRNDGARSCRSPQLPGDPIKLTAMPEGWNPEIPIFPGFPPSREWRSRRSGSFQRWLKRVHFKERILLYLRRVRYRDGLHHVLRESCWADGYWTYRDLMDLGGDPEDYIEYPGGNGFYFRPELEETLSEKGAEYSTEELEEVFLPYLKPHIRRVIEAFRGTGYSEGKGKCGSGEELRRQLAQLHSFDKRRLHFLRCGRIDIGDIDGRSLKYLKPLLCKSRDEIEHILEDMETVLRPREIRSYLFTALNVQAHFPHHIMRNHPCALDPEEVDSHFLREICKLNEDSAFLRGCFRDDDRTLHPYLVKYVILYFDHDFEHAGIWTEYIEEYMRRRRFYGRSLPKVSMEASEACRIMGISMEEFGRMSRKALVRRFRTVAKKTHPDGGGEHENFVKMLEAYEVLLALK